MRPRPLPRSLGPLTDESLPGYLLRLSHRLEQSPANIALITGLIRHGSAVPSGLLLRLDTKTTARFASACRLTPQEVTALCMTSLGSRYPPLDLAADGRMRQAQGMAGLGRWVFTRYCPHCLAGDGTPTQQRHGGAWRKSWRVPLVFACTLHQCLLAAQCPQCRGLAQATPSPGLLARAGQILHPAQCRTALGPVTQRVQPPACGTRLDTGTGHRLGDPIAGPTLTLQHHLLDLLRPGNTATSVSIGQHVTPAQYFLDLRFIATLIQMSWPNARHLVGSTILADALDRHLTQQQRLIHDLRSAGRKAPALALYDAPPLDALGSAGLLAAADQILSLSTPQQADDQLRALTTNAYTMPAWRAFAKQAQPTCSPHLSSITEAQMTALRPPSRRGANKVPGQPRTPKDKNGWDGWRDYHRRLGHSVITPTGDCQFDHRHIPQYMTNDWFNTHFADLQGISPRLLRRAAAIRLVQMSSGGSLTTAGQLLQIPPGRASVAAQRLMHWTRDAANNAKLTAAINSFADELNASANLIDYGHRRAALTAWAIPTTDWHELVTGVKQRHGRSLPEKHFGDRKRRAASVLVWESVTAGDHHLAPLIRDEKHTARRCNLVLFDVWQASHRIRTHPDGLTATLTDLLNPYTQNMAAAIDRGDRSN